MKKVLLAPGDDAAAEAVVAIAPFLYSLDLAIEWQTLAPGESISQAAANAVDTVLYGSSNGTAKGLGYLRMGWGTYANVRPVKWRKGVPSAIRQPEGVDYIIVRECLEDVYAGIEGNLDTYLASGLSLQSMAERGGIPLRYPFANSRDGRYGVKLCTREGVERVAHYAAKLALKRKAAGFPGNISIGGKWNVNPGTDGFFLQVAEDVIGCYGGITCNAYLADDFARRLIMSPREFDVVLLPNLYGDILSDCGIAAVGGLGMAPSGSYGVDRAYFEPIHGSAPDIVGMNRINPLATLLSAAMMFDHLGFVAAATRLETAVDKVLGEGRYLTPDLGGTATTNDLVAAVAESYGGIR